MCKSNGEVVAVKKMNLERVSMTLVGYAAIAQANRTHTDQKSEAKCCCRMRSYTRLRP